MRRSSNIGNQGADSQKGISKVIVVFSRTTFDRIREIKSKVNSPKNFSCSIVKERRRLLPQMDLEFMSKTVEVVSSCGWQRDLSGMDPTMIQLLEYHWV